MAFRICTIGCGSLALSRHGPSWARYAGLHPDVELAACCDLDRAKAERMAGRFGFSRHYADMDEMLAAERPDAVCLVVPVAATCRAACRVLAAGYPLLTEKPPGLTVEETDRMSAAAAASGAPSQVAFNRRHNPLVQQLRGRLQGAAVQHVGYEMTRVGRRDPDFSTTAIHGIDAVRWIAGSDYAHVRFRYHELPAAGAGVCNVTMDCLMRSGATAQLSFCPMTGAVAERAIVHAGESTFHLDIAMAGGVGAPGRLTHYRAGRVELEVTAPEAAGSDEPFVIEGFFGENAAFFDALRAGRRPDGDLRDARQSVEVAQHIRERREEYASPNT